MFPITVSPKCWLGHDWHRWDAYDDGALKPYGFCFTCGKEKFFERRQRVSVGVDTNPVSSDSRRPREDSRGEEVNQIWQFTDLNLTGLPIVVLDDDLFDYISNYGDIDEMDIQELFELLDDWVFEGIY